MNVIEYFTYDEVTLIFDDLRTNLYVLYSIYYLVFISYIVFCDVLFFLCIIVLCVRMKVMMIEGSPTLRTLNNSLWECDMSSTITLKQFSSQSEHGVLSTG